MPTFHFAAAEAFNARANQLLTFVKLARQRTQRAKRDLDILPKATLTDEDLIGEPELSETDYLGRTTARFFRRNAVEYVIDGDGYRALAKLADSVQSSGSLREALSLEFVESTLFDWVRSNSASPDGPSFTSYLESRASLEVRDYKVWIPIAQFHVESPLRISRSVVRSMGTPEFSRWHQARMTRGPIEPEAERAFLSLRRKFQGLAAVVTDLRAEQQRAREIALEEANLITSLLALLSGAIVLPDVAVASKVAGSHHVPQATWFLESPGSDLQVTSSLLEPASSQRWLLSDRKIASLRQFLGPVSALLVAQPTKFASTALTALLIYSKVAFTSDPTEKVIYALTALESLLLKSESEPIQQNLSERLAVFISNELSERKEIIAAVRGVYSLRSRYLHHGRSMSDVETVGRFLEFVLRFWLMLPSRVAQFSTKEQFAMMIDDKKMSGQGLWRSPRLGRPNGIVCKSRTTVKRTFALVAGVRTRYARCVSDSGHLIPVRPAVSNSCSPERSPAARNGSGKAYQQT